jgi:hypothetical protein
MARLGVAPALRDKFERNVLHAAMDENPRFRWCVKPGVRTRAARARGRLNRAGLRRRCHTRTHDCLALCVHRAVRERMAV